MGGMIPLGDASRRNRHWPVVTLLLIAANAYAFFLELSLGPRFVYTWSVVPRHIVNAWSLLPRHIIDTHDWLTLLTAMFLHASWMHIIGNMVFFWAFGPAIEDAMGHIRFLFFYLIGGVLAMLAQVAAAPASRIPCLGASGAIAAVMGAFIVTYPRDRIRTALFFFFFIRVTYIPAVLLIGVWILIQFFSAGAVAGNLQIGGVAYLAHIGGFAFGVLIGWISRRSVPPPPRPTWGYPN